MGGAVAGPARGSGSGALRAEGTEGAAGPAGCGAMRGGRRLFPLLLLALLPGLCHGKESAPGAVTCGSVLKLLNTRHSVRLHSHEVKYGSGEQGLAEELENGGARAVRGRGSGGGQVVPDREMAGVGRQRGWWGRWRKLECPDVRILGAEGSGRPGKDVV